MFTDRKPRKHKDFAVLDVYLREHYPTIFTKFIPMKIGIREDIIKENSDIDIKLLSIYLNQLTQPHQYLKVLANHNFRYDLQGVSVHEMSSDEKAYHVQKYNEYKAKMLVKQSVECPPSTTD